MRTIFLTRRNNMKFHVFGSSEKEKIILIHGVLTPWQIWQPQIDFFSQDYCVIVPALDGHVEEEKSEFVSDEEEARCIERYAAECFGSRIHALCGLSMGGRIAAHIQNGGVLEVERLILDGAPLIPINSLLRGIMSSQYIGIVHKSKERSPRVIESFKKDFLPEKYLESYLKFADTMTDGTIRSMVASVCGGTVLPRVGGDTKILFIHGTKGNEIAAKKSALLLKKQHTDMKIVCFEGYAHCEAAIYHPEQWIKTVDEFISDR